MALASTWPLLPSLAEAGAGASWRTPYARPCRKAWACHLSSFQSVRRPLLDQPSEWLKPQWWPKSLSLCLVPLGPGFLTLWALESNPELKFQFWHFLTVSKVYNHCQPPFPHLWMGIIVTISKKNRKHPLALHRVEVPALLFFPLCLAFDLRTRSPSQPNGQVDRNYDHILSPAPKIFWQKKSNQTWPPITAFWILYSPHCFWWLEGLKGNEILLCLWEISFPK